MSAGAVAMGFFVAPSPEFGNVRPHDVAGKVEVDMSSANAAFIPYFERHVPCVRHEVHRHLESPHLSLAAEIVFLFRRKAIGKNEIVVENEIEIVKQVHHERRAGYGKKPDRGVSLPVEVLVLCVQRNREQASRMPLEGLLLAVSLPYRSGSMTVENINHLFVKMFLRFQLCSRRDFADITVVGSARALEIDKCPHAAFIIPGRNFHFTQVLDKKPSVDWDLLRLLPGVVCVYSFVSGKFHWASASLFINCLITELSTACRHRRASPSVQFHGYFSPLPGRGWHSPRVGVLPRYVAAT